MINSRVMISGILLTIMVVGLSGCKIISALPDPGHTITLKPGESQRFAVTQIGGPSQNMGWSMDGKSLPWRVSAPFVYDFMTQPEDIGKHTVRFDVEDYIYIDGHDINGGGGGTHLTLWKGFQEWNVEVPGVTFEPTDSNLVKPGETVEYKSKVWPQGQYAYQWYLDGLLAGNNTSLTFSPTQSQVGTHIIELRAIGSTSTYSYMRSVFVTFASIGGGFDSDQRVLIQPSSDGGYLMAAKMDLGYSLMMFNISGDLEWQKTYGNGGDDVPLSLQATRDGGYIVAGSSSHDSFILKLDSLGEIQWQQISGGDTNELAVSIQQTADSGFIVVSNSTFNGKAGSIRKLNTLGELEWQKPNPDGKLFTSICVTTDGGYILTEQEGMIYKLSSQGDITWKTPTSSNYLSVIQQTLEGGYIAVGVYPARHSGNAIFWDGDAYVVKLDSNGGVAWQRNFGGTSYEEAATVQLTTDGGYLIAGWSNSDDIPNITSYGHRYWSDNGYIIKIDSQGELLFQRMISGPLRLLDSSKSATDNRIMVAGMFWMGELRLFKLDANGN